MCVCVCVCVSRQRTAHALLGISISLPSSIHCPLSYFFEGWSVEAMAAEMQRAGCVLRWSEREKAACVRAARQSQSDMEAEDEEGNRRREKKKTKETTASQVSLPALSSAPCPRPQKGRSEPPSRRAHYAGRRRRSAVWRQRRRPCTVGPVDLRWMALSFEVLFVSPSKQCTLPLALLVISCSLLYAYRG